MTLQKAFELGRKTLEDAGIEEARVDAWLLLEHVTGITRAVYYMDTNKELTLEQEQSYCACLARRAKRIPLQHITGIQEFMGMDFCVNEHVLIPRQDTEVLVESVLDELGFGMKILDMCTGSGCILVSLLKRKPGTVGVGADISGEALRVARPIAGVLGGRALRCDCIQSALHPHGHDSGIAGGSTPARSEAGAGWQGGWLVFLP